MKKTSTLFLAAISALVFSSCSEKAAEKPNETRFCLSDTMQQKVEISEVKMQAARNSLSLSGKIEANEDKWVKVYPVVGGIVESLNVQLGDYVKKGQVLAVIRSSEIADYQGQLSAAQSTVRIAEKNLASTRDMFKGGLATEKDVISAETDLEKANADLNRLRQTNAIYGSRGNAIQQITAPVSGYVIEKNVTEQMQYKVDGSQPFFIIANLDEVWIMANVFESDIARIRTGDTASIKVIAYPDKVFTGKVDRIFSILDPQSRVMRVRITLPNKESLLKPEMFAQINIQCADTGSVPVPAIPARAVIFDKNRNYVMVYTDKCHIETREVDLLETIGETAFIKSGLKAGEKVISQYQMLVYDALND